MLASTCTIDGASLQLVSEWWDAIDRVWVGRLACPRCGREWMDQRRPTQHRPGQMALPLEATS